MLDDRGRVDGDATVARYVGGCGASGIGRPWSDPVDDGWPGSRDRDGLDTAGYIDVVILAYAEFASAFYGRTRAVSSLSG